MWHHTSGDTKHHPASTPWPQSPQVSAQARGDKPATHRAAQPPDQPTPRPGSVDRLVELRRQHGTPLRRQPASRNLFAPKGDRPVASGARSTWAAPDGSDTSRVWDLSSDADTHTADQELSTSSFSSYCDLSTTASSDDESLSSSDEGLAPLSQLIGARTPARIKNDPQRQAPLGSGSARAGETLAWSLAIMGRAALIGSEVWPFVGCVATPITVLMSYVDQNNANKDKKFAAANHEEAKAQLLALKRPLEQSLAVLATPSCTAEEVELAQATITVASELMRMLHGVLDTYETAYFPPHEKDRRKAARALQQECLKRQIEKARLPADEVQQHQQLDAQIAALKARQATYRDADSRNAAQLLAHCTGEFERLQQQILHLEAGGALAPEQVDEVRRLRQQLDTLKADIDVLQGFVKGTKLKVLDFTDGLGNAEIKLFRDRTLLPLRAALDLSSASVGAATAATGLSAVGHASAALGFAAALVNVYLAGLDIDEAERERMTAALASATQQDQLRRAVAFAQATHALTPQEQQILDIVTSNYINCRLADLRWTKKHNQAHALRRYLKGKLTQVIGSPLQGAMLATGLAIAASNPVTATALIVTAGAATALFAGLFLGSAAIENLCKKWRKDRHKRRLQAADRFVAVYGAQGITQFYTGTPAQREHMAKALMAAAPKKLRKQFTVNALTRNYALSGQWLAHQQHHEALHPPAKGAPPSLASMISDGLGLPEGTRSYLQAAVQGMDPQQHLRECDTVIAEELFKYKLYEPSRMPTPKAAVPPAKAQAWLEDLLQDPDQGERYQPLLDILAVPASPLRLEHKLMARPDAQAALLALRQDLMTRHPVDDQDLEALDEAIADQLMQPDNGRTPAAVRPQSMGWLVTAMRSPELYRPHEVVRTEQPLAPVAPPVLAPTAFMQAVKKVGHQQRTVVSQALNAVGVLTPNPLGNSSLTAAALRDAGPARKAELIEAILSELKKQLPLDNVTGQPAVPDGKTENQWLREIIQSAQEQSQQVARRLEEEADDPLQGKQAFRRQVAKRQADLAYVMGACAEHLQPRAPVLTTPAWVPARPHGQPPQWQHAVVLVS